MKTKLVKAENKICQQQIIFVPTEEYPLQKTLRKQNKKNTEWEAKRMFKTKKKSGPSYLEIISDADSRWNMRVISLLE